MIYGKIEDGIITQYPIYEGDLKLMYPNTSFPTPFIPPEGYVSVNETPCPTVTYKQNVAEGYPLNEDGTWFQTWIVTDATPVQIEERTNAQWEDVTHERNAILYSCDWTQLDDAPLTAAQKEEWRIYRQEVRDVTNQPDPFNIIWPIPPAS